MATLPGLDKTVTKDPTPPATDTVVSPITIPNGTILVTTKTTNETIDNVNQLIDYVSGDNSPNFIPKSAIVDGSEVFTWTAPHDADGNNFLLSGGLIQFADINTKILQSGKALHFVVADEGEFQCIIDTTTKFSVSETKVNIHGNILDLNGGDIQFDNILVRIDQSGDNLEYNVDTGNSHVFKITNSPAFTLSPTFLNVHNKKIINVLDPTSPQDVVTKAFGDANYLGGGEFFGPWTNTHDAGSQILDNVGQLNIDDTKKIEWGTGRITYADATGFTTELDNLADVYLVKINTFDQFRVGVNSVDFFNNSLVQVGTISANANLQFSGDFQEIVWDANANKSIANPNSTGFIFKVDLGEEFKYVINTQDAFTFSNTDLIFDIGQKITGPASIQFAESGTSTITGIATALGIKVDLQASDIFRIDVDGTPEYSFNDTQADFLGNNLNLNGGQIQFINALTRIIQVGNNLEFDVIDTANFVFEIDTIPVLTIGQANINAHSRKIVGVEDPVNPKDVVTKAFGDANYLGGSGDVVGPGSSTANAIARFSGTTGKIIQNGVILIDGSANMTLIRSAQFANFNTQPGAALTWIQLNNARFELNTTAGNSITLSSNGTAIASFATTLIDFKSTNIRVTNAYVEFGEIGDPTAPGAALGRLYVKNVSGRSHLHIRDDVGVVDIQAGGSGDVVGPSSVLDRQVAIFDGTTGKIIQEGGQSGFPGPSIDSAGKMTIERGLTFTGNGIPIVAEEQIFAQSNILFFNASSAVRITISSTNEYSFDAIGANWNSNTLVNAGNVTLVEGAKLSVNSNATEAGFFDAGHTADPSSATEGDMYYNNLANEYRFFDGTLWVSMAGGGSDTPWIVDHNIDRFDYDAGGVIYFSLFGPRVTPSDNTQPYLFYNDEITPDAVILNVPSGDELRVHFNGLEEYTFSVSIFDLHSNIINNAGAVTINALSTTGILTVGRTNEVAAQDAGSIRFRGGNTTYAQIDSQMVVATSGSERGNLEFLVKTGNTTTMDSVMTFTGGTTATGTRIVFGATLGSGIDMGGNSINNVSILLSNDANPADAGFIRMGDGEEIRWENNPVAPSQDSIIRINNEIFEILLNSSGVPGTGVDYSFSETAFDMNQNMILDCGSITLNNGSNLILNTTTGTIIGTDAAQKLGFWNTTPIIQPIHITDPSGGGVIDAEARTAINSILAQLASMGLQASV